MQAQLSHIYGNYSQYIQIAAGEKVSSFVPFSNTNNIVMSAAQAKEFLGLVPAKGDISLPNGIVVPADKITGSDLVSAYLFQNGVFSNIEFSNLQLNGVQANGDVIGNLIGDNSGSLVNLANTPL